MNILNAAGFLIQRAVQTATQLQQQNREKDERIIQTQIRGKQDSRLSDKPLTPSHSSAYRVTLSAAAQQRIGLNTAAN